MNGVVRVALYARVSSQRQADEKTIDSQRQAIRERIENDGLQVTEGLEFCDDGYSGSELLRPALERLRDRVAASLVDRIYVHSADRLARNFAHQAILLEEFRKHDCEIIFGDHVGLAQSPEAGLLIQMQGVIAEYEREKILERTRRGRRYAATQGNLSVFGKAPYGYRYVKKANASGHARWEIEPIESPYVQQMFQLVGEQGYSIRAVCRELQRQGARTRTGSARWSTATVRDILLNPAYYGKARYGRERLVPRKTGKRAKRGDPVVPRRAKVTEDTPLEDQIVIAVPAIVSQSLFTQVRVKLDENQKRQRERQTGGINMLSGLVICGQCGSAYCGRRHSSQRAPLTYRCIGADKYRYPDREPCQNKSVDGTMLEQYVWSDLCNLLQNPLRLQAELERRRAASTNPNELMLLQTRIEQLSGRIRRLIDAYEVGLIEKPEFETRIVPLRAEHDRELATKHSLQGKLNEDGDIQSATRVFEQLSSQIRSGLADATPHLKRDLCKLLIRRIEILTEEIRLVYKVPQNPFVLSPDNRGLLQHWLLRGAIASRLGNQGSK